MLRLFFLLIITAALHPAIAQPVGFDEATGRDTRNYPPHRPADFQHMKLEIFIPDMNTPRLEATQTLTITPTARDLTSLTLDAQAMTIKSVKVGGIEAKSEYDNRRLTIAIDPPLRPDQPADIVIVYELDEPPRGLIWTPESPSWPGRAAQLHTQGQPETNSFWFPCVDFPNDRLSSEIIATVPAGFEVCSNGRLLSKDRRIMSSESVVGTRRLGAYEVFHWSQKEPHVPYLVTLVVGKFDIVDVGSVQLPMPVYAPVGRGRDVPGTYGRTPDMIAHFARLLDEPYPWDRYAQLVVWNFGSGGMENTSATTLYDHAIIEPAAHLDHDLDDLISHELAHQWFGDLITCNSWEHIWLNEGFATYMTQLWYEERDGKDAYLQRILADYQSVIDADKNGAPAAAGLASKTYNHPWDVFRRAANPYDKGSSALHMLRTKLGDEVFFRALRVYIDRYKMKTVETSDLRTTLEEVSGLSLDQFFRQWCARPGVPRLEITTSWIPETTSLEFTIEQRQPIDGDNPAFEFTLPVYIAGADSRGMTHTISVNARAVTASFPLDVEPTIVAIDPNLSVLADLSIHQPATRWLAQLNAGPTLPARIQAARGLAEDDSIRSIEFLRKLINDPAQPAPLRVQAVKTLAERGAQADVRLVLTSAIDSWEVRLATTEAAAAIPDRDEYKDRPEVRADIAATLADRAAKDKSVKVRAATIRALGRLRATEHDRLILAALDTPSQGDALRQAALDALADLKPANALKTTIRFAGPAYDCRTRATALAAVAKLGSAGTPADKDAAYNALRTALRDRDFRTQRAACEALVELADPRALTDFQRVANQTRAEEWKQQLNQWARELEAKLATPPPPP